LHSFSPFEPPREADNAIGKHRFHDPGRGQLGEDFVLKKVEIVLIFTDYQVFSCKKAVFERIFSYSGFALRSLRPGRFLGISAWITMTIIAVLICLGKDIRIDKRLIMLKGV
jgi:hypothetical protein